MSKTAKQARYLCPKCGEIYGADELHDGHAPPHDAPTQWGPVFPCLGSARPTEKVKESQTMTPEFDAVLNRLRLHSGKSGYAGLRVEAAEARVLVAALDAWKEALLKLAARYYKPDILAEVADALGISVREVKKMVAG